MKKADVLHIDKEWWKKKREPVRNELSLASRPKTSLTQPLMSVKDVAQKLNVGIWSIYDYIASNELECQIVGRRKRISIEALDKFLITQNLKHGRK